MRLISFTILIFFSICSFAQDSLFFVQFTDKDNSPYMQMSSDNFLSERAINRRTKYNIPLDKKDYPPNPTYINGVSNLGFKYIQSSKWLNGIIISNPDSNSIALIENLAFVESVKNVYAPLLSNSKSIIQKFDNFDNLPDYQFSDSSIRSIGLEYMHVNNYRGDGMIIAVLDAGFSGGDTIAVFEHLRTNNKIVYTNNVVNKSPNVYGFSTHGTSVLSIMAGNQPLHFIGGAPEASYALIRTENASSETLVEEIYWSIGAEQADSIGADLINSSLGYTVFDHSWMDHTHSELDGNTSYITIAADIAASKGVLVVNSAGNEGNSSWHKIGFPADADSILTVGAVNYKRAYAPFSSSGNTADQRIKPDIAVPGWESYFVKTNNEVSRGNGTSFSAPLATAAAACLWQALPDLNNMEIIQLIKNSGHQSLQADSLLGYGIPNFGSSLFLKNNSILLQSDIQQYWTVFPNPVQYGIFLQCYALFESNFKVAIFDMNGKIVYHNENLSLHQGFNSIYLKETAQLQQGSYLIALTHSDDLEKFKIIKL